MHIIPLSSAQGLVMEQAPCCWIPPYKGQIDMRIIAVAVLWLIPKICSWLMNVVVSQKRVECAGISFINIHTNHCIVDIIVACALLKTATAVKSLDIRLWEHFWKGSHINFTGCISHVKLTQTKGQFKISHHYSITHNISSELQYMYINSPLQENY